ncbi:MAG TPA: hypothetical protein VGB04_03975 [Allosphingosinicella sp.]
MLRTADGDCWGVTFSDGMERFIGPYSRVPGLRSDDRLLEYRPAGCPRSGSTSAAAEG